MVNVPLMSRYGFAIDWGRYMALIVLSDGQPNRDSFTFLLSARPVFYLESTINLNGSGTLTDPYIIIS